MTPFEFGQILGSTKQANFGQMAGQVGNKMLDLAMKNPRAVYYGLPAAGGAVAGGTLGAYHGDKGQKMQGALRGAASGAVGGLATAGGFHMGERLGGNLASAFGVGIPASIAGHVLGNAVFKPPMPAPATKSAIVAPQNGGAFNPLAMNMGGLTNAPKTGPGVNGGLTGQKINYGGGNDMLSKGMGALQSGIESMKKLSPQSHQGNQI